jgi:Mg-chelatase subunit ChlD
LLLKEHCAPTQGSTDVVLVIDVSSSMEGPTRDGGTTKREAARRAAIAFVQRLGDNDRVGVVVFSEAARVFVPLTADRAAARRALQRLPAERGTRIDAGLRLAVRELAGRRPSPTVPAILLVTDGQPTRSSAADVLAAGAEARAAGLTIYAVGLGADVNPTLMRQVAGDPSRYYPAPDAEDLEGVYRTLAREIPCPSGRHDWGQDWP